MNHHFKFSESKFWKNIVKNSYSLKHREILLADETITLYETSDYFSNSPYITDAGYVSSEKELSLSDLRGIKKTILLKFRSPIKISQDIEWVLIKDYFTFILDLSGGKDFVWNTLVKSKTRNQVRKAKKTQYSVKYGKGELIEDFYKIISEAWRDLGTPTHSKKFYKNIVDTTSRDEPYNAEFIILYIDNKPAGGAVLIYDDFSLHHPYAATLKQYNHLSLNNALYWEIIEYAISKNIKVFDLGRSQQNQGTATYKKSWGAEPIQLYYYYINKSKHKNEEDNKIVKTLIEIWKKLPLKIANYVGPKIIYKVLK